MTPKGVRTPRLSGPLSAALAGAGFFFLAAALGGLGPLDLRAPWARALQPGAPKALTALRVDACSGPPGDRASLARDLRWLRDQDPALIVLEADLDAQPPSPALALESGLAARLKSLPSARARRQALAALEAEAASLHGPEPLNLALAGGKVLLAYTVRPGLQDGLAPALRPDGYRVTLRGQTERLPPWSVVRLPDAELLTAASSLAALPLVAFSAGKQQALIGCGELWLNSLGLDAARLALNLPLDALRIHWKQGLLSSLDLAGRHLALDPKGEGLLPGNPPALDTEDLSQLQGDKSAASILHGRVLFFRPWPLLSSDADAFDGQSRLFLALMEAPAAALSAPGFSWVWVAPALVVSVLVLAWAPLWLALPLWAFMPLWTCLQWGGRLGLLLQGAGLCLACLCLGLAARLWRAALLREGLERRFRGKTAPAHWPAWAALLNSGEAALPAAYAALGPAVLLHGPAFEAWMERWGLFQDAALAPDAAGFLLAGAHAEARLAKALLDARHCLEGVGGGIACGTLVFRRETHLGFTDWTVNGLAKERAWTLLRQAGRARLLLGREDLAAFETAFETRPEVAADGADAVQVLGPRVDVWMERP